MGIPRGRALRLPGPEEPSIRLGREDIDLLLKILSDVLLERVILFKGVERVLAFGAGPVGSGRETVFVVEASAFVAAIEIFGAISQGAAPFADDGWVSGVSDAGFNVQVHLVEMFLFVESVGS